MGQTTIFNFMDIGKMYSEYIIVEDLPEFVDVDLSHRGPFRKGETIKKGDVSDVMIEILLKRGLITPKK